MSFHEIRPRLPALGDHAEIELVTYRMTRSLNLFVRLVWMFVFLGPGQMLRAADGTESAAKNLPKPTPVQPVEMTPSARRKLEALKLILEDADSAKELG